MVGEGGESVRGRVDIFLEERKYVLELAME